MAPTLITHKMLLWAAAIIATLLGFIAIFALILGRGGEKAPKDIALTVWGFEDENVYKKTFDAFLQSNPNTKIVYRKQNPKQYLDRIKTRKNNTRPGERPDIFLFHNSWNLQIRDVVNPAPATVITEKLFQQLFYPMATEDLIINKQIIGLPTSADNLALFYNTPLLGEKGISPPQDWEAFSQAAVRLTTRDDAGVPQTAGAAIGTAKNITYFSDILGAMFLQQGTNPTLLGDGETNSIIEYYSGDITRFAKGMGRVWDANAERDIEAFAKGKVAMIFAPSVAAREIMRMNPSLQFATAPIPQLRPEEPRTFATYWAWGVSRYAPNTELAWRLAWKLTERAALIRTNSALVTTYKVAVPYPRRDLASRQENDPILGAFIKQADDARTLVMASQTQDGGMNDKIVQLLADAVTERVNGRGGDLKQLGAQILAILEGR